MIVEVRGRSSSTYLPRHTISPAKRRRLFLYARGLRENVTVVLLEVIGQLPRGRIATWCLGFWPELFGIRMRALVIEE